jgi:hypothetical protein
MEHRLATEDEEYPKDVFGPDEFWDDDYYEEEDCYDFPEDDGDGLFDPMEKEDIPAGRLEGPDWNDIWENLRDS